MGGIRKEILTLCYIFSKKNMFFSQMALFMRQLLIIPGSLYILLEKSWGNILTLKYLLCEVFPISLMKLVTETRNIFLLLSNKCTILILPDLAGDFDDACAFS